MSIWQKGDEFNSRITSVICEWRVSKIVVRETLIEDPEQVWCGTDYRYHMEMLRLRWVEQASFQFNDTGVVIIVMKESTYDSEILGRWIFSEGNAQRDGLSYLTYYMPRLVLVTPGQLCTKSGDLARPSAQT